MLLENPEFGIERVNGGIFLANFDILHYIGRKNGSEGHVLAPHLEVGGDCSQWTWQCLPFWARGTDWTWAQWAADIGGAPRVGAACCTF